MEKNLLIVEDEPKMREAVRVYFTSKGYTVTGAENGIGALELLQKQTFDLLLLDVMMPGMDGFSLCRKIRRSSDVPILFLTARSDEDDSLFGFELGADDYVTKPFSLAVLLAKCNALLARTKKKDDETAILSCGGIRLNPNACTVTVQGAAVSLPSKEYALLLCLLRHKNQVLSRNQLLDAVWGPDYYGSDRVVDGHMKNLRQALGAQARHIKTVIKAGYRCEEEET